jgi:glucose/arabinose dehydrogenase
MNNLRVFVSLTTLLAASTVLPAAEIKENQTDVLFSGTIRANYPGRNTTMKGLVIKLGEDEQTFVCYDTDLMRLSLAWTGKFLKFGNYQREIVHPQPPEVAGTPLFGTKPGPGWAKEGLFTDPRENHQGPLPRAWAKYRGLYRHGKSVILSYTVGETEVLEMPTVETVDGEMVINRILTIGGSSKPLTTLVAESSGATAKASANAVVLEEGTNCIVAAVAGGAPATWEFNEGKLSLKLPRSRDAGTLQVSIWKGPAEKAEQIAQKLNRKVETVDLAAFTKGATARWPEPIVTQGMAGTNSGGYAVDTLTSPVPNQWGTRTFFGGFDFFPDGRAAICTFHGDVWVVSGIDEKLEKLQWRRYASGLFQALGVKVVDGEVYVTGRDQITRLHDLNKDGEADYYENFNNDTVVTPNYHEFSMDLQTDREGNFYYAKGAPWPPNVDSPHQGTLLKVSKDGSKFEIFATGFRAPNGMGMGPHDEITVSDNQGHWMPASKLNIVKGGGFYGMIPAAHTGKMPTDFEKPICWLPMNQDNSSGGQVWTMSDKWGPLKNHMLFMSYGKGTIFHVMHEEVDGVTQAAMVRMPFKLRTGVMRGRVHPKDGQVYLCGLRGWQTDGVDDGAFYRVRYTGQSVHMPVDMRVVKEGVRITFTSELSPGEAGNVENYDVEQWNYKWSAEYGSPEFSPSDPKLKKHDKVTVQSAKVSSDRKTVLLEIPEIKPVDQMRIKFRIAAADGTPIAHEIYNTIHRVGGKGELTRK